MPIHLIVVSILQKRSIRSTVLQLNVLQLKDLDYIHVGLGKDETYDNFYLGPVVVRKYTSTCGSCGKSVSAGGKCSEQKLYVKCKIVCNYRTGKVVNWFSDYFCFIASVHSSRIRE
ncbi:unnamed protein product [Dracunculus medinensis]|uniref:60S ribosomal export protein NMD3 n=1 Tax=Dracunculus medinensis TaxID=318479 RepID=A0A0N4UE81_DRAME|nr:unnamed protein product [Dracunculus medinensis]